MNAIPWRILLCLVCLAGILTGCDDGKEDMTSHKDLYSNKMSASSVTLQLRYNGEVLIGKDVCFEQTGESAGNLYLMGILPGETETLVRGVLLVPGANGNTFSGNSTGQNGTSFQYEGVLANGNMTLNLTDVKLASNRLTEGGSGVWRIVHARENGTDAPVPPLEGVDSYMTYYHPTFGNWVAGNDNGTLVTLLYNMLLKKVADNALSSVLDGITFGTDGNLVASYAGMPDTVGFASLMNGYGVQNRDDWTQSPVNLVSYHVKDDSLLYISPNVDMIIRQIEMNRTKAASDGISGKDSLVVMYQKLNQWTTTGLQLTVRTNPARNFAADGGRQAVRYDGDIILVLKKSEIAPFFALLGLATTLLGDISGQTLSALLAESGMELPESLPPIVGSLLERLTVADALNMVRNGLDGLSTMELGIYLKKATH